MENPYAHNGHSLTSSAKRALEIIPNDAGTLVRICKALRIFNPAASVGTVRVATVGGDTVTLHVPAGSVSVEALLIERVYSTGTSAGLTLVGLSD